MLPSDHVYNCVEHDNDYCDDCKQHCGDYKH